MSLSAELKIHPIEELHGLRLVGELDLTTTDTLDAAIAATRLKAKGGLVLDLAGLSFMDSTGIRAILTAAREYTDDEPLVLANPTGEVHRVLEVSGLAEGAPGLRVEPPQ